MMIKPANIIWFTGLSGVGKTTLSKILKKELIRRKYKVFRLMAIFLEKNKKY